MFTTEQRRAQLPFGPLTQVADRYLKLQGRNERAWRSPITFNPEWTPEYSKSDSFRWVENPANGLRYVGKAHEIRGNGEGNLPYFDRALVDHEGWFTDEYHDGAGTIWGEVFQLPARDGKSLYVPAVSDACGNNGSTLDFHSITDDLKDAIRWADSMAERMAESEREYQVKANAENRIEDIDEEIKTKRADFLTLAREIRANCDKLSGLKSVRQAIRESAEAMRREIRKLAKEKEELTENPYAPIERYWSRR